jgi:transposase-like protein
MERPMRGARKLETVRLRDREWLAGRIDAGLTNDQIAGRLGCCPTTVSKWIGKHDLRRRVAKVKPAPPVGTARERARQRRQG